MPCQMRKNLALANAVPNAKKSRPSKYRANRPTIKIKIILRINRTILFGVRIYGRKNGRCLMRSGQRTIGKKEKKDENDT